MKTSRIETPRSPSSSERYPSLNREDPIASGLMSKRIRLSGNILAMEICSGSRKTLVNEAQKHARGEYLFSALSMQRACKDFVAGTAHDLGLSLREDNIRLI